MADALRKAPSRGRFAPSTTGRAHPGTLLAGLLCWLDARARGGRVFLRLEDLDVERTKAGFVEAMIEDLDWLGLDWDGCSRQSEHRALHEAELDRLVAAGRVYACDCSRADVRRAGLRAPDGSYRYPGTCRRKRVRSSDWRSLDRPLRLHWESAPVAIRDESGADLSGDPAALYGDPLLRRRDGAFSYHFASVVDDAAIGVDRVVRGRDLALSTVLQVGLQRLLGYDSPTYHHHLLLLESHDAKLSKLHGAVDVRALRERYRAPELCGLLAALVGLVPEGERVRPHELVAGFSWSRVTPEDIVLRWSPTVGLTRIPWPPRT